MKGEESHLVSKLLTQIRNNFTTQKDCISDIFLCITELRKAIFETIKRDRSSKGYFKFFKLDHLYNYLSLYEAVAQLVEQDNS